MRPEESTELAAFAYSVGLLRLLQTLGLLSEAEAAEIAVLSAARYHATQLYIKPKKITLDSSEPLWYCLCCKKGGSVP